LKLFIYMSPTKLGALQSPITLIATTLGTIPLGGQGTGVRRKAVGRKRQSRGKGGGGGQRKGRFPLLYVLLYILVYGWQRREGVHV
jgi:hypothetical protein